MHISILSRFCQKYFSPDKTDLVPKFDFDFSKSGFQVVRTVMLAFEYLFETKPPKMYILPLLTVDAMPYR